MEEVPWVLDANLGGDCSWEDVWEVLNSASTPPPASDPAQTSETCGSERRWGSSGSPGQSCQQRQRTTFSGTRPCRRRIRRENERQRSLHVACTLLSVTSLTPGCEPELGLTQYQRLSQLVRYTAFLEDATSALVKELGVRLNFDFSPVTRYIRRLRHQTQSGSSAAEFDEDEADELSKLLETMSAGEPIQSSCQPAPAATPATSWRHRSASAARRTAGAGRQAE